MESDSRSYASRVVILHWVENALLVLAILALGWYAGVRVTTIVQQARDSRTLDQRIAQHTVTPVKAAPPAPDSVIGRLDVPRLGLTAIVREGTESSTLERAVGHLPETALPGTLGNAALAGHRDTFFRTLRDIKPGDRVIMTMPDRTVTYEVQSARVVAPRDVSVLDPTPLPTLTLITCHPFTYIGEAPNRFVVQAVADRAEILAAPSRLASRPVVSAATLVPAPTGTSGVHARTAQKIKPRSIAKAKKARAAEAPKKGGFWRKLGRIFR